MSDKIPEIVKKMRRELEERGVIGPAAGAKSSGGYAVKRSKLVAYKERFGVEYQMPEGALIIEDL